jgi:hypothetical protein
MSQIPFKQVSVRYYSIFSKRPEFHHFHLSICLLIILSKVHMLEQILKSIPGIERRSGDVSKKPDGSEVTSLVDALPQPISPYPPSRHQCST